MGKFALASLAFAGVMAAIGPGWAAGPGEPDWPCIQRRQPQLSIGQVWAGPAPSDALNALAQTPKIRALADVIALRRTELSQAEALIADFAKEASGDDLTALFFASFERIQNARDRVMRGITGYSRRQDALDQEINRKRQDFAKLSAASAPDFDAIDKLEAEIEWSTRIFQDRQQSLTYVCETPVILEQRAFALGRAILNHLPK